MTVPFRIVYVSKNQFEGTQPELLAEVEEILAVSRRNNANVEVTGALMLNGGAFAQVLEGPQTAVEDTFERIQRDPRHCDVTVLECGPVEARSFSGLSMAFVGESEQGHAVLKRLAGDGEFDLRRLDGDAVMATLRSLVFEEETSAATALTPTHAPMPASPPAPTPLPRVLDEERLREALAPRPAPMAPAAGHDPVAMLGGEIAAIAILKAALADERSRTSALRAELDEMRIKLSGAQRSLDTLQRQRDLWTQYARALTESLSGERPTEVGSRAVA